MKTSRGFTLIELIVVMAVLAVLVGATALLGMRTVNVQEFERVRETARNELVAARSDTIAGSNDSAWGVKFNANSAVRFKGNTYASRVSAYDRTTSFGNTVTISGTSEVDFTRPFGAPSASATIILSDGSRTATMTVNTIGTIQIQ